MLEGGASRFMYVVAPPATNAIRLIIKRKYVHESTRIA
jgi:hypothetical protein